LLCGDPWTLVDGSTLSAEYQRSYGPWVHLAAGEKSFLRLERQFVATDRERIGVLTTSVEAGMQRDWETSESAMADALRGRLFILDGKKKKRFQFEGRKEPEFYVFYFAAMVDRRSQSFTPALVATYKVLRAEGVDNFEVFLASADPRRSQQFLHMDSHGMPWPAIDLNRLRGMARIHRLRGQAIPNLVITDREGRILASSFRGEQSVGPFAVLRLLENFLYWTNPGHEGLALNHFGQICERLLADPPESASPIPFFVDLGSLLETHSELSSLRLELKLNSGGQVEQVIFEEAIPADRAAEIEALAERWLFLPKVEDHAFVPFQVRGTVGEFVDGARESARRF
jgi:hypothetical protein